MFKVGTFVGGKRWPNHASHPDAWGKPIGGKVLEFCDIRAWANTIQFPMDNPPPGDVMGYALKVRDAGMLDGLVPVAWELSSLNRKVYWEKESSLHTFADDMILWRAAKEKKMDEILHPRRKNPRPLADFLPETMKHLALA